MGRFFITHEWRLPKAMIALLVTEFPFTVAMLTLAGIAQPDTYRTKLWQNGSQLGFNSDPSITLYQAANYQKIHTPVVWSHSLTQFNVVISVLSMFILLVKSTMYVMHGFLPILSVLVHILLIALYAVSVRHQSAPDLADPKHPSPGMPWMMSKGCKYAFASNHGYCQQAVAQFAVTILMLVLFVVYLCFAVYSCLPTPSERATREADIELRNSVYGIGSGKSARETDEERADRWERNRQMFMQMPKTPSTPAPWGNQGGGGEIGNNVDGSMSSRAGLNPMTPRTVAFTTLNNGTSPTAKTANFSQRELPFREAYGKAPDGR